MNLIFILFFVKLKEMVSFMEGFEEGKDISKQTSKVTLKKFAFYCLSPVLISLALASTVIVCMSSVLRFVFVVPLRVASSNDLDMKLDMKGIMNVFRVFFLIGYACKHLIEAPFYLLGQILVLPGLAFAWIKSAFVGFAKLADFVCSDEKEILASNRLDKIEPAKSSEDISSYNNKLFVKRYDGTDIKSGSKAIFGYTFGIYDFDVKRSPSSKPEAPKIEAQFCGIELYRMPGRKWM